MGRLGSMPYNACFIRMEGGGKNSRNLFCNSRDDVITGFTDRNVQCYRHQRSMWMNGAGLCGCVMQPKCKVPCEWSRDELTLTQEGELRKRFLPKQRKLWNASRPSSTNLWTFTKAWIDECRWFRGKHRFTHVPGPRLNNLTKKGALIPRTASRLSPIPWIQSIPRLWFIFHENLFPISCQREQTSKGSPEIKMATSHLDCAIINIPCSSSSLSFEFVDSKCRPCQPFPKFYLQMFWYMFLKWI